MEGADGPRSVPRPSAYAKPNLLAKIIYRDSNILDHGRDPAIDLLLRMQDEGWVQFMVTDTALLESLGAGHPGVAERLVDEIGKGLVSRGPKVPGHSAEGFAVHRSAMDRLLIERVHFRIWKRPWVDDVAGTGRDARNRLRDTLHVSTAIRYAADAFVTDDEPVQRASGVVAEAHGLAIWSPEDAVAELGAEIELMRKRWARNLWSPELPNWPSAEDLSV